MHDNRSIASYFAAILPIKTLIMCLSEAHDGHVLAGYITCGSGLDRRSWMRGLT